jgi:hypothetical protein
MRAYPPHGAGDSSDPAMLDNVLMSHQSLRKVTILDTAATSLPTLQCSQSRRTNGWAHRAAA